MPDFHIRGIVEVMENHRHEERARSLGAALGRLSAARSARGPVGLLDPLELHGPGAFEDSLDEGTAPVEFEAGSAAAPYARGRRGLFSFSDRARDSVR